MKEEDFLKWVNEYKGPFIVGLSAVKRYTLTSVKVALQGKGGPPAPVETPYKLAGIVDLTSIPDYGKDIQSKAYQEEFMPQFVNWVKDFLILQADELWDEKSD